MRKTQNEHLIIVCQILLGREFKSKFFVVVYTAWFLILKLLELVILEKNRFQFWRIILLQLYKLTMTKKKSADLGDLYYL